MYNSVSRINFLTIYDAHQLASGIVAADDHTIDFKCADAHLSFWWNRGNEQLVVRDMETEETFGFDNIDADDALVWPILYIWMCVGWVKRA